MRRRILLLVFATTSFALLLLGVILVSVIWRSTVAGRLLIALRTLSLNSPDNAIRTVGSRFLVPTPWLPA